jgi:dienelactone hydrolase
MCGEKAFVLVAAPVEATEQLRSGNSHKQFPPAGWQETHCGNGTLNFGRKSPCPPVTADLTAAALPLFGPGLGIMGLLGWRWGGQAVIEHAPACARLAAAFGCASIAHGHCSTRPQRREALTAIEMLECPS